MAAVMEERAIFENAGQAVHVAFLVMAQEATQDAPFRMALIRVMETLKLDNGQRHWLDQLRGDGAGTVNFSGLSGGDIRAQCALITQAVKTHLPAVEMWVLQAKFGQTDFEDVTGVEADGDPLSNALIEALARESAALNRRSEVRSAFSAAMAPRPSWVIETEGQRRARCQVARDELASANHELATAESSVQLAQIALDQASACKLIDNGRRVAAAQVRRRWAFSAGRIEAIKGLSDWFAPMFPRIKPLAIDCMLGRLYANHKKIDISARDLATQFGGNHTSYLRASWKMKNHLRILEEKAIARLEPIFFEHGVSCRE